MAKTGLIQYLRDVRSELKKINWPSRRETIISTVAVFIMVFICAVFLYFADQVMAFIVRLIMGFEF